METRYILHIGDTEYVLQDDDLRNWDEIRCSYKCASYDGVVRSFTSQFEFVNRAGELLLALFLKDRFNAVATISVFTKNDSWLFDKRFECRLDFSTVTLESRTFKINSVDNSLASVIKANKGTKYEFAVGETLTHDRYFHFDRLPMRESLTYEFTQGESYDDCADLMVTVEKGANPYIGNVGSEISINLAVDWNDDQTDEPDSFLFKAVQDIEVTLDYEISWREDDGTGSTNIMIQVRRDGKDVSGAVTGDTMAHFLAKPGPSGKLYVGSYSNTSQLISKYPTPTGNTMWALVGGKVWEVAYNGREYYWSATNKTPGECFTQRVSSTRRLTLKAGDEVYIASVFPGAEQQNARFRIVTSRFLFTWMSRGNSVDIPVVTPEKIAGALLRRMCGDEINVDVRVSGFDTRLAGTYLFASESARDLPGALFHTSFNDFCDWMSAVFGYVYYIDTEDDGGETWHTVRFVHRSELLDVNAPVSRLQNCRDVKYSVDTSVIYSAVTAGYDKKDYDSVNGRDEFNFNNTYSTGCTVSDKTLSLISRYRADCYGIEFAVQKRGEDTTDSAADRDVFFVLCKEADGLLIPDRDMTIANGISAALFNGAFSPMACVRANAGYIGLQGKSVSLEFASSKGNSSIVVGGEAMSAGITLDTPVATCGVVEFTTDSIDDVSDVNGIIEVEGEGVLYRGYLKEVDIKYARAEATKYKLIVKDMVL